MIYPKKNNQMNRKYEKVVLPNFLNCGLEKENIFKDFNFKLISENAMQSIYPICPICLRFCVNPCLPNNCTHTYCVRCLKLWSKQKKLAHYAEKFLRKLLDVRAFQNKNLFNFKIFIKLILLN